MSVSLFGETGFSIFGFSKEACRTVFVGMVYAKGTPIKAPENDFKCLIFLFKDEGENTFRQTNHSA